MSDTPNQPNIIDQIADERDELRDENQMLRNYIKKLENVGDYWMTSDWISHYGMRDAKKAWYKAKESKP